MAVANIGAGAAAFGARWMQLTIVAADRAIARNDRLAI
jgi:hypothetical protein